MLKFIQIVSILIGLSFVTLMVAFIITLSGGLHLIYLVFTIPVCLFVWIVCSMFKWTNTKTKGLAIWCHGNCPVDCSHQTDSTLL